MYDYGREGRRIQVLVANTDIRLVNRAKEVVGCGHIANRKYPPGSLHKGRKVVYQYQVKGSERGLRVLDQIIPYLIVKREKAEAIVKELHTRPFGRWAATTPEARKRASEVMKASWLDPAIRAKRIAGLRESARRRREVVDSD